MLGSGLAHMFRFFSLRNAHNELVSDYGTCIFLGQLHRRRGHTCERCSTGRKEADWEITAIVHGGLRDLGKGLHETEPSFPAVRASHNVDVAHPYRQAISGAIHGGASSVAR